VKDNKEIQKKFYDKAFEKECVWSDASFSESTKYFTDRFIDVAIKPESKKILEIGCGNGLLTFFLLKKEKNITAIDISKEAIKNIQEQFSKEIGERKLRLVCGDIISFLDNCEEKFDVIIGSGIIHHIEKKDWPELFSFAFEKLNPGGVFACGPEPNAGGIYRVCWRFAGFFYKLFGMDYDWEVERGTLNIIPRVLESELKKAGFHNSEVLSFQFVPHFRLEILTAIDKKIINYVKGKFSLYIIVKGEKI
jgi:SAM-dependent methyltransferase